MKFIWAEALWLLLVVPMVAAAYVHQLRRGSSLSVRFPGLAQRVNAPRKLARALPPALMLLALTAMIVAIARPTAVITLPSSHETIVLAIDVSGSMRAADVKPSRLAAAQAAARTFIEEQPRSTRIGVVSFAASATVVQHPTQDRDAARSAIDRLQMQQGTALGSAIVVALGSIFPGKGITVDSVMNAATGRKAPKAKPIEEFKGPGKSEPENAEGSAAIILLTDGQANTGVPPADAAQFAADRGVRIFTIGTGTPSGETMTVEGWRMRVRLDEESLKEIANVTRGQYFHAGNANDMKQIYKTLSSRFMMQRRETEVTAIVAGIAALIAAISALLSFAWFNRIA